MRASSFVSLGIIIVSLGCGGAAETGLFGSGDGTFGDAGTSTDSGRDGGVTGDAGVTFRDGGNRKDSGPGFDAGSTFDTTIPCGTSMGIDVTCNVGSQFCCAMGVGNGSPPSYMCESPAPGACAGGIRLPCNDTADCHGEICCGTFDSVVGHTDVSCKTTCTPTATTSPVRFCDDTAPTDECVAIGLNCHASQALPGYAFCK